MLHSELGRLEGRGGVAGGRMDRHWSSGIAVAVWPLAPGMASLILGKVLEGHEQGQTGCLRGCGQREQVQRDVGALSTGCERGRPGHWGPPGEPEDIEIHGRPALQVGRVHLFRMSLVMGLSQEKGRFEPGSLPGGGDVTCARFQKVSVPSRLLTFAVISQMPALRAHQGRVQPVLGPIPIEGLVSGVLG